VAVAAINRIKTLTRKYLLVLIIAAYLKGTLHAEIKLDLLYNIFNQGGRGGKQVYDGSGNQDLSVNEPILSLEYQAGSDTTYNGSFLLDAFTGASDKIFDSNVTAVKPAAPNPPREDAITSASQASGSGKSNWETRTAYDFSVSHKIKTWVFLPSFGYSESVDYKSVHGGFNVQKSFAEDNFTLSAGMFHYNDSVQVFDLNAASFVGWTPKITDSYNFSASQILGVSDIVLAGGSFTRQSGRLSSNRNTVDLAGTRAAEVLPDERNKITSTVRYIHGLNSFLALHLDYRYYSDDWELRAHTFEPSLAIAFGDNDEGLLRLIYRYYIQNAVNYYKDSFGTRERFMTSDSDLEAFFAHEVGAQVSYRWDLVKDQENPFSSLELGGGVFYYERSNDLNAMIYQFGISTWF
jgi:hypothetical protein